MTHSYTINVTQDDINEGVRKQFAHCIVSTAIGRQVPEATRIEADIQTVRFTVGKERLVFMSPREVAKYILAFDAGIFDKLTPMTIKIANPIVNEVGRRANATRLIVKGTIRPKPKGTPTRTRAYGLRTFEVNRVTTQQ